MATVIQTPLVTLPASPSNNYIWFSVDPTSSFSGLSNYYYQYEIQDENSNVLIRNNVKVYDNVWNGYAIYDAHKVLNNYVSYETKPLLGTVGFYSSENSIMKYKVYGNEYTGSTLLSNNFIFSGYTVNAAVDRNDLTNQSYFDYTPYIMTATTYGKFLSPWIGNRYVRPNDRSSLAFLQTFHGNKVDTAYLAVTKSDGSIVNYTLENTISTSGTSDRVCYLGCGPYEIDQTNWSGLTGNVHNAISNNSAVSYTIYVGTKTQRLSEIITFILDYDCSLIYNAQVMWLNKHGSYSNYTFYKELHQDMKSERTTYTKNDFSMDSGYLVQNQYDRGETILTNKVNKSIRLKSKIVNDSMSQNLSTIFESPEVFILLDNGKIYPVIVDMDSIEVQYNRNGRAVYEFTLRYSNDENEISN